MGDVVKELCTEIVVSVSIDVDIVVLDSDDDSVVFAADARKDDAVVAGTLLDTEEVELAGSCSDFDIVRGR